VRKKFGLNYSLSPPFATAPGFEVELVVIWGAVFNFEHSTEFYAWIQKVVMAACDEHRNTHVSLMCMYIHLSVISQHESPTIQVQLCSLAGMQVHGMSRYLDWQKAT